MKNPFKILFHEHPDMPSPTDMPSPKQPGQKGSSESEKHVIFFRKDNCLVCCGHPESLKILKKKLQKKHVGVGDRGND